VVLRGHAGRLALALIVALLALACAGPGAATDALPEGVPASYALAAENASFALYVDPATLAFKLLDRRSGYLWHSGLDEIAEGDRLNRSWQAFARSGVSIEYLDARAVNRRVSISNEQTTLAVTPIADGVSAQLTFDDYGITLGITLQLGDDGVRVELPYSAIREDLPDVRLGRVYLYPFLGATRGGSIPGYMLVPDGSGSLIRFADSTRAHNMFYGRYYGADLGMLGSAPWDSNVTDPSTMTLPVFGIAHGEQQHAFLSVIERGAAYGELQVHPAGIITNFNFLYNAFVYNEPYFQATNRSGAGVTTVQRQSNAFDAVVHYRFLTGDQADYVGMARSLQRYLLDRGMLARGDFSGPDIGIRLEFLGGDKEAVLLWHRFIPMTTIAQMRDILAALDLPNPEVIYYGWQPGGANSMPPGALAVEGGLGSADELRGLAGEIAAAGGRLALYLDPQAALWGEPGYSPRTDLAMAITSVELTGYHRAYNNYFTLPALQQRFTPLAEDLAAPVSIGLALDGIGYTLYSDFRQQPPFTREQAIAAYQALLGAAPVRLGFYQPNDYLLGLAQAYYDMPLGDNGYIYTSAPVPFLPIVLAGHMPAYGPALNFSSSRRDDMLRQVEYGVYPSYFLTHEPTANILNTLSYWIYTSSYAQWGEEARRTYAWMNALLSPVRGQEIIAHGELAPGVFATTYASGQQIIVNYTDAAFTTAGLTVPAKDALRVEAAP
jgi:hypothetical protein